MSELLKTLLIVKSLSTGDKDQTTLRAELGVSTATFNRYLAEARHLGAQITAYQSGRKWFYKLENWAACEYIVTKWIELEEKRSIV